MSGALAQRYVQIRAAEISVPFGNLVFENQLVPESIPCEVGDHSMILVPVVARVSENDVWTEVPGKALELILDRGELGRKVAVSKFM